MAELDDLAAELARATGQLVDTSAADHAAAEAIAAAMRVETPVRSGYQAAHIRAEGAFAVVETSYALAVARGVPRHGMRANPFDQRAVDRASGAVMDVYEQHVIDALEGIK